MLGPLFQQRPYPAPGAILKQKRKRDVSALAATPLSPLLVSDFSFCLRSKLHSISDLLLSFIAPLPSSVSSCCFFFQLPLFFTVLTLHPTYPVFGRMKRRGAKEAFRLCFKTNRSPVVHMPVPSLRAESEQGVLTTTTGPGACPGTSSITIQEARRQHHAAVY